MTTPAIRPICGDQIPEAAGNSCGGACVSPALNAAEASLSNNLIHLETNVDHSLGNLP
jgi:hypothetical protein